MALLKHDSKSIRTDLNWDFSSGTVTGIPTGSLVLIKTLTASSSSSLSFVNGSSGVVLDSTYKAYKFVFKNIHPSSDVVEFMFQADTGTNTNYNQTITSTVFRAFHDEADSGTGLAYYTAKDQAQGTSYQPLSDDVGNGNDECMVGELFLFNPSSTTFVKHFMARTVDYNSNDHALTWHTAGYFNTTSAITSIDFKFEAGNIDAGTISLYGLTT